MSDTQWKKEQIIDQLHSQNDDIVNQAIWILCETGGLKNGMLRNASLEGVQLQRRLLYEIDLTDSNMSRANLADASLRGATLVHTNLQASNLRDTKLCHANLTGANLNDADLRGADLQDANLQGASLLRANMQGGDWENTNLQGANLREAKLQGTLLLGAKLQGTDLKDVSYSEQTTLPDGTIWEPFTDMARFTDPTHSSFWLPVALSTKSIFRKDRERQDNLAYLLNILDQNPRETLIAPLQSSSNKHIAWIRIHKSFSSSSLKTEMGNARYWIEQYEIPLKDYWFFLDNYEIDISHIATIEKTLFVKDEKALRIILNSIAIDISKLERASISLRRYPV